MNTAGLHVPEFRPVAVRFLAGFVPVAVIILASFGAGPDTRLLLWTVAVVADVATPAFTLRQQAALPPISTSKFPERFGLFTLIVIGESIIGVINGVSELSEEGPLSVSTAADAALGLAIGFGLWWLYFDFIARRPPRPSISAALGWVYLHLGTVTAITMTGVGVSAVIADHAHGGLQPSSRHLVATGVACALLACAALESTLHRTDDEPTHPLYSPGLKAAGGVLALAFGWGPLPWGTASLLASLLALLAVPAGYGARVWFTRGPGAA